MAALNTAVHLIGQAEVPVPLPVAVVGAGLPSLPAQLAEATSDADRLYDYRPIGLLEDVAGREALTVHAYDRGVEWGDGGLGDRPRLLSPPSSGHSTPSALRRLPGAGPTLCFPFR